MNPHGTWARYNQGCRLDCCRTAARNYQKQRLFDLMSGRPRKIDALGTHRRIEALLSLGWGYRAMGDHLGLSREAVRQVHLRPLVFASTAEDIDAMYRELCMRIPVGKDPHDQSMINRTRKQAAAHGYAPPLAWDDIDTDAAPNGVADGRTTHADLDDWMFLVDGGTNPAEAAHRLGVTISAISRTARRHGRLDVARRADTARALERGAAA